MNQNNEMRERMMGGFCVMFERAHRGEGESNWEEKLFDFITSEIEQAKKERTDEIVGMCNNLNKKEGFSSFEKMTGWQNALDEIITNLTKETNGST